MSTATDTITILVNGDERDVPEDYPLTEVLRSLNVDPDEASGVAVALNGEVVRRPDWEGTTLHDEDVVEVIQAQQGG